MDYSDPSVQTELQQMENEIYSYGAAEAEVSPEFSFVWLVVAVIIIASMWRIFNKAGKAGWKSLIPFYNIYVLLQIVGRPGWWLILMFIPFVNLVVSIILAIDLAKSFGKSTVFGVVGLFLFGFVGYPMLAFGSAQYQGPADEAGAGPVNNSTGQSTTPSEPTQSDIPQNNPQQPQPPADGTNRQQ